MGIDLIASRRRIITNSPHLVTPTPANPVSFAATLAAPLKALECAFSPVQAAGTPAPDNVLPITGWTGCNVGRASEYHICVPTGQSVVTSGGYTLEYLGNGKYHIYGTDSVERNLITNIESFVIPSGDGRLFKINNTSATNGVLQLYNPSSTLIDFWNLTTANRESNSYNSMAGKELSKINIVVPAGTIDAYIQPEFMNTNGMQTLAVQFPAEAGTIYGGYIDPVRGVARAEWGAVTITEFSGVWGAATNGYAVYKNMPVAKSLTAVKCNMFKESRWGYATMPLYSFPGGSGKDNTWTFMLPDTVTSLQEANAWLAAQSEPLVIVYTLATPIDYPLTPAVLKTLKGANVIFTDLNGNITPTYWTH